MTQVLDPSQMAFATGRKQLFVGGGWVDAANGSTFDTLNPADEQVLAAVASGSAEDIDRAVAAARKAFRGTWSSTTPYQRGRLLSRVGDLILENQAELALLETLDTGKPLALSTAEVGTAASHWHYFAGWADKIEGSTSDISSPIPGMEFQRYGLRRPLGVVGLIVPWNFPLVEASYKLAPALTAGNTVVLKPAEQTPLTALRLGEIIAEAGLPEGVVNIVTGDGVAGAALAAHEGVDKISFTGSTSVGRKVLTASAGNMKKVTLELGGKSPGIIFADADIESAIVGASQAAFMNSGQVCTAASRLYVERSVHDQVLEGISAAARMMKVGNGLDPETQLGPLISAEQLDQVSSYVDLGRDEGGIVVSGGEARRPGYFYPPTVFSVDRPDMRIVREEIFGPVVVVQPFDIFDEVISASNDSEYGLSAGVWTSNATTAARAARQLEAGIVWVNNYMISDPSVSVGGMKNSGVGYDMGPEAIYGFTHLKNVVMAI
ncbi:aldehyde dehydrogenase family protein [Rhodococcus koreensis]|uniref:aldehyde dehydrogenase family protein n=1 Tax=Rhodococcus koreensis TaxID=99653 RepID=UPI003671AF00